MEYLWAQNDNSAIWPTVFKLYGDRSLEARNLYDVSAFNKFESGTMLWQPHEIFWYTDDYRLIMATGHEKLWCWHIFWPCEWHAVAVSEPSKQ